MPDKQIPAKLIPNDLMPWHASSWQTLFTAHQSQQLAHAILLHGPAGVGKLALANAFAKMVLCQQKNGCNHCSSCRLFSAGTHPDFTVIQPEEGSRVIKIDAIRQLTEASAHTAHQQGYKVVIIAPAEAMNMAASNALLKTLEEPISKKVLFMLVTHQLSLLPATIRSRCMKLAIPLPTMEMSQQWLSQQNLDYTPAEIDFSLLLANGAPLAAREYLVTNATKSCRDFFIMLSELATAQSCDLIQLASHWQKHEVNQLMAWLSLWLKLQIYSYYHQQLLVSENFCLSKRLTLQEVIKVFHVNDQINEQLRLLNKHVPINQTLLLETIFLKIRSVFYDKK